MTANYPSREDVLDAFAVEDQHDRETLEAYLRAYPDYAEDLIDLSYELNREVQQDVLPLSARDIALFDVAWRRYSGVEIESISDPFAALSTEALRGVSKQLDIPRQVLAGFQERRVLFSSVPQRFLKRMAQAINSSVEILQALSPDRGLARSYKAETKPSEAEQVSFERLLIDAGVPEAKRAELLADGD